MRHKDVSEVGLSNPEAYLDIGITGHRSGHPVFSANREDIAKSLTKLLALLGRMATDEAGAGDSISVARVQMHSLLAYGADLMGVHAAIANGWTVAAPLPFGRALNLAINAQPTNLMDMDALLNSEAIGDATASRRAKEISEIVDQVHLFELAEQDQEVEALYRAHLTAPNDETAKHAFVAICSDRAAMAARVMVEHSDLLIGIWDGETRGAIGGTRHTIEAALEQGIAVVWIDARNPDSWHVLRATEELAGLAQRSSSAQPVEALQAVVREALRPSGEALIPPFASALRTPVKNCQGQRRTDACSSNCATGRRSCDPRTHCH